MTERENRDIECYWNKDDGYVFTYKNRRLWQEGGGFIVATRVNKPFRQAYEDEQKFHHTELWQALEYLRTGKRL